MRPDFKYLRQIQVAFYAHLLYITLSYSINCLIPSLIPSLIVLLWTAIQFVCIIYPFFAFVLAELTQFQPDGNLKSFTHDNGRLMVQKKSYYNIYAQVFFESYPDGPTFHNRVALAVNGNAVSLIQTALGEGRADYGSLSTSVVKYLNEGDYISLKTVYPSRLWVTKAHTFFGAYRVRRRA